MCFFTKSINRSKTYSSYDGVYRKKKHVNLNMRLFSEHETTVFEVKHNNMGYHERDRTSLVRDRFC